MLIGQPQPTCLGPTGFFRLPPTPIHAFRLGCLRRTQSRLDIPNTFGKIYSNCKTITSDGLSLNTTTLFSKFSQGVNWNGIFYSIHKTFSVLFSFILFTVLTTAAFSTWANINSVAFLLLLWVDFGMRKSIPRYLPEFAKNRTSHKRFIKTILLFQALVLVATAPLVIYLINYIPGALGIQDHQLFIFIAASLFIGEGIIAILRLIYHAHFWNKQFNLLTIIALGLEMAANIVILLYFTPLLRQGGVYPEHLRWEGQASASILKGIFATKLISGIIVSIGSIIMLTRLYKDKNYPGNYTIDYRHQMIGFAKHSGIMWANNNIKSLTERNFLIPLFTYIFGAGIANLFKIANDGALFFHRLVLKTIGTTDTALLSHIQTGPDRQTLMPIAFTTLIKKMTNLCIPLATILFILFLKKDSLFNSSFAMQAFFIMTIGYLAELLLSPYERMLEIEQRYLLLLISYTPYLLMIIAFVCRPTLIASIGLVACVALIHIVRFASAGIMFYFAKTRYAHLTFPLVYVVKIAVLCAPIGVILHSALTHFSCIAPSIGALFTSR